MWPAQEGRRGPAAIFFSAERAEEVRYTVATAISVPIITGNPLCLRRRRRRHADCAPDAGKSAPDPGEATTTWSPARPLIARLLNFRNHDKILQSFRMQGPWKFNNTDITAYLDYTMEVQCRQTSYVKVKQLLCVCNITYSLLFTARLWAVDEGKNHIFPSPKDAWMCLHAKGLIKSHREDPLEGTWLTPQRWRKKRSGIKMRPSKVQVAEGQAQALIEATQITSNPYTSRCDDKAFDSDSSMGRSSESTVPLMLGPEVTPCMADDL
ncbi:hypothetical protein NDU88_007896 [Pleurodeles waltl]|uniref:Uncharacterized protein n=1 Tax=Pleurodeles waltl TaxID=8319 RepID=A0AAV7QT75_PLEWA|nr:hypothetical protein NDU88_007896 [Pleurodeles waltl]